MDKTLLAVNGTLMRGLELHANMLAAGARFVREAATVPEYRLWSIGDRHPAMIRVREGGAAIAVEVWDVPAAGLGQILLQEPPGLCIGKVRLASLRGSQTATFFISKFNRADLDELRRLIESGHVRPVVEKVYGFAETADALRHMGEGHARGKIVISV